MSIAIDPGPGPLRGPVFSSFRPDEVSWLLADYSHLDLERDVEVREAAVQSGAAHYADDLPREWPPADDYTRLFDTAMARNSVPVATAVIAAAEVLAPSAAAKGIVLASLARAGVPAGIWLKRRLESLLGEPVPHYAMSIVRDRGLDLHALAWIAQHHDPATVVFVDGWTGKGTIRSELKRALCDPAIAHLGFRDTLVVIADPGGVADVAGTRTDLLIPSACLNSTSCGLVSRTVLPRTGASSSPYHGAKHYRQFRASDRSRALVDAVVAAMSDVAIAVRQEPRSEPGDPGAVVRAVMERVGITDIDLIKPGIGETTRVLQRRVPWRVLVHPEALCDPDLDHVHALAARRGTPVGTADTSPYRCIGIIRPWQPVDV